MTNPNLPIEPDSRKKQELKYSIDEVRRINGLPPLVKKKRECLKCGREFVSRSKENRLCGSSYCSREDKLEENKVYL